MPEITYFAAKFWHEILVFKWNCIINKLYELKYFTFGKFADRNGQKTLPSSLEHMFAFVVYFIFSVYEEVLAAKWRREELTSSWQDNLVEISMAKFIELYCFGVPSSLNFCSLIGMPFSGYSSTS